MSSLARRLKMLALLAAAFGLAGCVEQLGDLRGQGDSGILAKVAAGATRGANVALASVEGAPAPVTARFTALFNDAATAQDMTLTAEPKANYLIRGYLSAYKVDGGTAIGYVWDIFDAAKHRTQRVTDAVVVKGGGADAWAVANEAVLASLADKSINDLAVFLSGTPEALAAAAVPAPVARPLGQPE